MEVMLLTLALFITLLLPESIRQPLALAAVVLLIFRWPEQLLTFLRERLHNHRQQGLARCPCCAELMASSGSLCRHCILETSLLSYRLPR